MSIMPAPFSPAEHRGDPNQSTSEMINKIEAMQIHSTQKIISTPNCCDKKREAVRNFVQNIYFHLFITLFTVTSLFLEDFRILFVDISSDPAVDIVNIIFIFVFTFQIALSMSIPGYFLSFFFFLDILSTLSIIMDISLLTTMLYESNSSNNSGVNLNTIIKNSKASRAAARTVRVMKIFRLARIVKLYKSATKTKELNSKKLKEQLNQRLNSMKLKKVKQAAEVDLVHSGSQINIQSQQQSKAEINSGDFKYALNILTNKILPSSSQQLQKLQSIKSIQKNSIDPNINYQAQAIQQESQSDNNQGEISKIEQSVTKVSKSESRISKLLSDNTMKKIIMVILLLMFSVPILDTDNYYPQTNSWDFLTDFVVSTLSKPEIPLQYINKLIKTNIDGVIDSQDSSEVLVLFKTPFKQLYYYDSGTLKSQRVNDMIIAEADIDVNGIMQIRNSTLTLNSESLTTVTAVLSCKSYNQTDSWFSISKILFICIGIIYLLNTINEKISQLITDPIEKMLQEVNNNSRSDSFSEAKKDNTQVSLANNNYQTTNVHQAMSKISGLISKIFGARGKQTIYKQIFKSKSIKESFLSQSKSTFCLIGLCKIANYDQISAILQEEALTLSKQVSQQLHSAAFRYGCTGMLNQQGSFLVLFECPQQYQNLIKETRTIKTMYPMQRYKNCINNITKLLKARNRNTDDKIKDKVNESTDGNNYLNILTDFSIFSMVKTLVKINKQPKFFKYRKNAKLIKELGENFQIKINCVLHAGWTQVGFLGSTFKMDHCYFGKSIDESQLIAHHCFDLKRFSGIILSQDTYKLCTIGMQRYTRIAEKFINEENSIQKLLYMVDLNAQNISPPKNILDKKAKKEMASLCLKKMLNFEHLKDPQQIEKYKASIFINSKKELREVMKNVISEQFRRKYNLAYHHLVNDEISQCKQILEQLTTFVKDDILVNRLTELSQKNYQRA